MNQSYLKSFLLIIVLLISCNKKEAPPLQAINPLPISEDKSMNFKPEPKPQGKFAVIMDRLKNPKDNHVMICAHRGISEKVPENSLAGIKECINLGIEIVEIDLSKTKDGKIILMHDKTLERTTTGRGKVSETTLAEIKKLYLKDKNGKVTSHKVPTLEKALDVAKGKILVQMDKWNGLVDIALPIIKNKQCLQQSIFRSTLYHEQIKATFKEYLDKIIYIPVIPGGRKDAQAILEGYLQNMPDMPIVCLIFPNENNPILNQVATLKEKYRIWFNAISEKDCGNHGDILAQSDTEKSYGWLVNKGANIIFTDKAILVQTFLKSKGWR